MITLRIKEQAQAQGINSVGDLVRASGISDPTVRRLWHRATERLDFQTLGKLCKTLNCDVGDLVVYEREKGRSNGGRK